MKLEVHTLRYGSPGWLLECAPTLDSWTERHGYPLRIWTDRDAKPDYPWPKFCLVDMWEQFAKGDSDWMLYVDADIYVRHDAPKINFLEFESELLMPRSNRRTNGRYEKWRRHYGDQAIVRPERWWLRNCGWMAIDKKGVQKLLRVVRPPYRGGTMDECQVNEWVLQAYVKHGLKVTSPPKVWHRFHWRKPPGFMWHVARPHNKMEHLRKLKATRAI